MLSAQFILEVMKVCLSDHLGTRGGFHCHFEHEYKCERNEATVCTCETCKEMAGTNGYSFIYPCILHPIGPESISVEEIKINEHYGTEYVYSDGKVDDCTHTVELCYTRGTAHQHHALYGVNEDLGLIELWAN